RVRLCGRFDEGPFVSEASSSALELCPAGLVAEAGRAVATTAPLGVRAELVALRVETWQLLGGLWREFAQDSEEASRCHVWLLGQSGSQGSVHDGVLASGVLVRHPCSLVGIHSIPPSRAYLPMLTRC